MAEEKKATRKAANNEAKGKIDPFDVAALEKSVNDSAVRVSTIWLSFVVFELYLAAAASNISHRQLFLEDTIKLPTVNIELPLFASALLLPTLFVVYHIYVLLQILLLGRTAAAYNEALNRQAPDDAEQALVRQRLANTLFAQMFAGSPREKRGFVGLLLRLMAWATLALAPVFVLLVFEFKFLPYHDATVTWVHRSLVALDLLAILLLWSGALDPRIDITGQIFIRRWPMSVVAVLAIVASCLLLTFPGEPTRFWTLHLPASEAVRSGIAECRMPKLLEHAFSGTFDRLFLPGESMIEEDKLTKITKSGSEAGQKPYETERTRKFRGRDFNCANFSSADLRHTDFSNTQMKGARLEGVRMQGVDLHNANLHRTIMSAANFDGARLEKAVLDRASLRAASLQNANLKNAHLAEANLRDVRLNGAILDGAQLPKANLGGAELRGASLIGAKLQGVGLEGAELQGAKLQGAILPGARLGSANLTGADLRDAELDAADLNGARLQGSNLSEAALQGANLSGAGLQGTSLGRANLDAAGFKKAFLQGATFDRSSLKLADFSSAYLWRTAWPERLECDTIHVAEPKFEAAYEITDDKSNKAATDADEFVRQLEKGIPEAARGDFRKRIKLPRPGVNREADSQAQKWIECAKHHAPEPKQKEYIKARAQHLAALACKDEFRALGIIRGWITTNFDDDISVVEDEYYQLAENPFTASLASAMDNSSPCPGADPLPEKIWYAVSRIAQGVEEKD